MRTQVAFKYASPTPASEEFSDILTVAEAAWLVPFLRAIERLEVEEELCQEDWGVVAFARRDGCRFWIGLSGVVDGGEWIAHVHHGSFDFLQWLRPSAQRARDALVRDFETALRAAGAREMQWFARKDVNHAHPSATPED